MLIERIRTSLWLPKIIFGTTIVLCLLAIGMAYAYIQIGTGSVTVDEVLHMADEITYTLNPGG
jgi:hypothetical protein